VFTTDDLEGLPTPVRAYFENTLQEGQPYVDLVRLTQDGKLRLGGASSSWKPFTATQHVTVDPQGFSGTLRYRSSRSYRFTSATSFGAVTVLEEVSLYGVVPLDRAGSSRELNEAELVRYLAEAVWYPTALLPSEGVQWEPVVDAQTAKATIHHGDVSALTHLLVQRGQRSDASTH